MKIINQIPLLLLLLLFNSKQFVYSQDLVPWSVSGKYPVIKDSSHQIYKQLDDVINSNSNNICLSLIKFYQVFISPVDGDRCLMYPTCSQYSFEAIQKHGSFIGIIMTTDRLIHESEEQDFAHFINVGKNYRYIDPIENNDFWWHSD